MKKRSFLALAALASPAFALAQSYPGKPITFVVPSPAGGGGDALARALADVMSKRMGQPILVDNKPGAAGMLGTQFVARAAPDGYTLLVTHAAPVMTAPFMYAKPLYDVRRDLDFVSQLCTGQLVLAVNTGVVPAKTMREFMAWAEQHKGRVNYGSFGIGSASHLIAAYFSEAHKLDMLHVAYKGEGPMVQDLVGGQVAWAIGSLGVLAPHFATGRLRPLAVLGAHRPVDLPNVPTMAGSGFADAAYKPIGWVGMLAPPRMPAAVMARLEQEVRAAVQTPAMKARFQVFGMEAIGNTAAEFRRDFESTAPLVERMVKLSGAKVD